MIQFLQSLRHKFTSRAQKALEDAVRLAGTIVKTEHLLFSILTQQGALGQNILKAHKIELGAKSQADIEKCLKKRTLTFSSQRLSPAFKIVLKKAMMAASWHEQRYVGTEHLLYGILASSRGKLSKYQPYLKKPLSARKASLIISHLEEIFAGSGKFPDVDLVLESALELKDHSRLKKNNNKRANSKGSQTSLKQIVKRKARENKSLERFAINLIAEADQGNLDPVVSREIELRRLIRILTRRVKNNPIIVGEPGVGKTALVYGLAQKIAQGEVPQTLLDKKLYSLDLGLLISGTVFRGEFEGRLKDLIQNVAHNDVILFIDEIHNIVGAGSAQGSLDAANILKPSLSRGEIQVIGATTYDEYRRYIEKDKALERRFQPIFLKEMDTKETVKVIKSLRPNLERFYSVVITDAVIERATLLAKRYIHGRFFPDKAIDLIDEACAHLCSYKTQTKTAKQLRALEKRLIRILEAKEQAVLDDDFEKALRWKNKEEKIVKQIRGLHKEHNRAGSAVRRLTTADLAYVVSESTNIPLSEIKNEEKKRLLDLEKFLNDHLVGQEEVTTQVANALRRARLRLSATPRPIASFLFLGPTGVGKTEMARLVARYNYAAPSAFTKIDMSEFMEPHSVSRLLGAPAGYIGYDDGDQLLTERVRKNPHSLILFDEIEKAHPNVINILLQILEDGTLTDAQGNSADFSNTIVILTSNIGSKYFLNSESIGFDKKNSLAKIEFLNAKNETLNNIKNHLKPELISRLDHILVFRPLDFGSLKQIVAREISQLTQQLAEHNITLSISESAVRKLAGLSFDQHQGARLVRKNIQRYIEDPITKIFLKETNKKQKSVRVTVKGKTIGIS